MKTITILTIAFLLLISLISAQQSDFTFFQGETYDKIPLSQNTQFVKANIYSDANIDLYIDNNLCEKGKYDIHFCPAFNQGNVFIDAKPAESGIVEWSIFDDKKNIAIEVFGTEYFTGDQVKTWLQLTSEGGAVNNASCFTTIYYPDNQIEKDTQLMSKVNDTNGIYFFDTVADVPGVHMVIAQCIFETEESAENADAKRVIIGTDKGNPLSNTFVDDASYQDISPIGNVVNVTYNFTGIQRPITTLLDVTVKWNGILKTGTPPTKATFYLWNFTKNDWEQLPNTAVGISSSTEDTATNTIPISVFDAYFIDEFNNSAVRIFANGTGNLNDLRTDLISINYIGGLIQNIQEIRGGGEIHVNVPIVNFTATLNASLDASFSNDISALNDSINTYTIGILNELFNANLSIHENINDTRIKILSHILNINQSIITDIGNNILTVNNSIQQNDDENTAEILATILNINISLAEQIIDHNQSIHNALLDAIHEINSNTNQSNEVVITYINSQHAILNGTIENSKDMLSGLLSAINSSIQQNDDQNMDMIINALSININSSQSILIGAIGNDTTIIENLITGQTNVLNQSLTETETNIINEINLTLTTIQGSVQDSISILNGSITALNGSIVSLLNDQNLFLQGIIGNDTQIIINALNDTSILVSFFGNDTPQIISQIGNDTQIIIDTLNDDFGNNTQIIIDNILENTTLDIDDLQTFITSEINDVQSDIVSEINDVQSDISSQTTTLTSSIVNTGNTILQNDDNNTDAILNAISAHNASMASFISSINISVDTFIIASSIWNYENRTLSDFLFNVSLENTTVSLDDNVTNFITGNIPAEFEVGACFQNQNTSILLGVFLLASIIMILVGFMIPWTGVFGSFGMVVLSWFIASCVGSIGYIIASIGIVGIIFFVTRKNPLSR